MEITKGRNERMKKYLTAESVCIGHPDKLCDRISDAVLDAALKKDPDSHVAVETLATDGKIVIAGEINCRGRINVRVTARDALREAGYDPDDFTISVFLHPQSNDIAEGVRDALESRCPGFRHTEQGAGDQGTVYGYATDECSDMLPLPLVLSHRICRKLDEAREKHLIEGIHSDGKAQVTVEYDDGIPVRISAVVISIQHDEEKTLDELRNDIFTHVIPDAFRFFPFDRTTPVYINPSGRFVKGGPAADTGLTGRKLMVDTYGGLALHGGGAFSGKDPSKVDRSGAYAARFAARNIILAGLAKRCTVAVSYAIGKASPVAVNVDTHATGKYPDEILSEAVRNVFPLKPEVIISRFNMKEVRYTDTSCYGHFSDCLMPWEDDDRKLQERLLKELENGTGTEENKV